MRARPQPAVGHRARRQDPGGASLPLGQPARRARGALDGREPRRGHARPLPAANPRGLCRLAAGIPEAAAPRRRTAAARRD
eukprot:2973877-Prymnesium_polylepis.1